MLNCPTRASLELLLEEALGATEAANAALHVEGCSTCQGVLHDLVSSVAGARSPAIPLASSMSASHPTEVEVEAFLERLKQRVLLVDSVAHARSTLGPTATTAQPEVEGYEILEELGRGAVGIVYRARHRELNRFVALKMILAGPFLSPKARQRFRVESQAIARLQHPNIVQVYDVGEQSGSLYLALELVEGGNLAALLAAGPRPSDEAARLVASMAHAVEYAHSQGVIHRDLKPANVLLGRKKKLTSSGRGRVTNASPLADCDLKLTDFGLAKVAPAPGLAGDGMTLSGEFLGTPAYTAPEQARGDTKEVGPQADVYSLGAILYELLTGRPPFQGASALETLLQVAHHDPVPPARLVPKVPRDLDTICLKCLEKDPAKRFATAAEFANDLERFLAREPILARRAGRLERSARWIRRRPARAAVLAGSTVVALGLLALGLWLSWQRATTARAVNDDLRELALHERACEWVEARTALERAKARLGNAGFANLQSLVDQGTRELELAARLDSIRLNRATLGEGRFDTRFNKAQADREYTTAFKDAGLGGADEDPQAVAALVAASNVTGALVAALDDWAAFATEAGDTHKQAWLLEVARRADPDPTGWRDRVRDQLTSSDTAELGTLAETAVAADRSVQLLVALGERLTTSGGNAVAFLRRVQNEHPGDFWANFALANALVKTEPTEAIGYYRAALATRPQAVAACYNLGKALHNVGRFDEAIDAFQRALRIEPKSPSAHNSLGLTLSDSGRLEEAIEQYELALALDPNSVPAHINMGVALTTKGRSDEAFVHDQLAVQLEPENAHAHSNLGLTLLNQGRLDEAIAEYQRAIEIDPDEAITHSNLGFALHSKGRFDAAIEECTQALQLDPKEAKAHNNLGLALHEKGRLDEAIEHFRQAMQLDPKDPKAPNNLARTLIKQRRYREALDIYRRTVDLDPKSDTAHNNLGAALANMDRLDEAIDQFRQAVELAPSSVQAHANLGTALLEQGQFSEARVELREWLELLPHDDPLRSAALGVLQRCERLPALELRLPAVLQGQDKAVDAAESLQFADLTRIRKRYATSVRFYADAFALAPSLSDDLRSQDRNNAACLAARAARGDGDDTVDASEAELARLRTQAREWLQADLLALEQLVERGGAQACAFVRAELTRRLVDPDFTELRESSAIDRLPASEQQDWRTLWNDVEALMRRARDAK